ncbi:MAG: exodeoxyribonuclease VII large subunit [Candidatus Andersenbacteria bacterium RIFCSPHIGHO2_02_FULL_45_11]|nr:MAG: exodeoxyribonuclease VII large subunit [Candidatus Andersenbacteria bacterium RIFCSPHIGHO2_01_FULL_46_36]OGY34535.1 MAG: exodeoxyribonuclease VII large subunit [Candidatus Andersenbacteria bacterium RIFCSPHIGHO2_02_FULL_45_11]
MEIVLTVSQCVEAINIALDSLGELTVEGEVADFKIIQNKWVTFDVKDNQSVLKCFMTVWSMRTQIEDGMLVKVTGQPNLRAKGFLSFVAKNVQPSGEGSLKRAFELLKKKLEQEGLFALDRKRSLPRFPQHVALITSRDAAAYADFLKVLTARYGGMKISFIHTQVQGADAPAQIIGALQTANTDLTNLDVIILVRGGGSLEDLMAFNDEHVVRAVAGSRTPIIVAIGHERDVCLAELAADVRASTPSNAAELLIKSRQEITLDIDRMRSSLSQAVRDTISSHQTQVIRMTHAIGSRLTATAERARQMIARISSVSIRFRDSIARNRESIENIRRMLVAISPEKTLARGYSITRTASGNIVHTVENISQGEAITTTLAAGTVKSVVEEIMP